MKKFYFSDYNDIKQQEQDLQGEDFDTLLETCLQFCSFFSFDMVSVNGYANHTSLSAFDRYEITDIAWEQYRNVWKYFEFHESDAYSVRHYYQLNKTTKNILKSTFNSLFSTPYIDEYIFLANLTFFRSDKTIFFCSETHEGDAFLFVKNTESVRNLLSLGKWEETPLSTIGYLSDIEIPRFDS